MGGLRLRSAKVLFVPSLKRDIVPSIAWTRPPAGGVAWQSTSDGGNLYLHWAAQQLRGRSRRARSSRRMRRVVGFVARTRLAGPGPTWHAFRPGLSETGYVEGRTSPISTGRTGQEDRMPAAGRRISFAVPGRRHCRQPAGYGSAPAAKAATATIPIVFTTGLRTRFRIRPRRQSRSTWRQRHWCDIAEHCTLGAKRVGLLRMLDSPRANVIAMLVSPSSRNTARSQLAEVIATGGACARAASARSRAPTQRREIDTGIRDPSRSAARRCALRQLPARCSKTRRDHLVTLAERYAMPAVFPCARVRAMPAA